MSSPTGDRPRDRSWGFGDARTLVIHPASTTHQQLTLAVEDIRSDLDQALTAADKTAA